MSDIPSFAAAAQDLQLLAGKPFSTDAQRLLRSMRLACLVLLLTSLARIADAETLTPEQMANEARARAATRSTALPEMPLYQDQAAVERLADEARARGKAAFEHMAQQSPPEQAPQVRASDAKAVMSSTPAPGLVVVALSSSMPPRVLRDYLVQLDGKHDAVVVLRGFIGGASRIAPTDTWLEPLLRKDADCDHCGHRQIRVVIDPLAYRSLGITQVPAVAFLPGVHELAHCDRQLLETGSVAYGAVAIDYALKALAKRGVAVPPPLIAGYEGRAWRSR